MEWLNNLIPEKYLFTLGWMIVHALWQVAGIGLLLWLGLKISHQKSAAFKYRLTIAALGLIAFAGALTFAFYATETPKSETDYPLLSEQQMIFLLESHPADPTILAESSDIVIISRRIEKWIPTMVNLWFVGALLFMVRLGSSLADIRNLRYKTHQKADARWLSVLEKQTRKLGLGKTVALFSSLHVDVPMTYGTFKPVILIPASLIFQLSPVQLEAIIAHELAHIKRYDYLVNLFQSFLEIIFFFHPVFWWINKTAKEQRENACDDMAINIGIQPLDLAHGLANVLNHAQSKAPEIAMAAVKPQNPTLERIKRIMGVQTSSSQPSSIISITMIITLVLSATLMVGASDKQTSISQDEFMATELTIQTIEKDWLSQLNFTHPDTVPPVKIPAPDNWGNMSEKEKEKWKEDFGGYLKDTPGLFKEVNPNFKHLPDSLIIPFIDLDFSDAGFSHMHIGKLKFEGFDFSEMPVLKLKEVPFPEFNLENMPKWEFDNQFRHFAPDSTFLKDIPAPELFRNDSTMKFLMKDGMTFRLDTSKKSKEERERLVRDLAQKRAEYQSQLKPLMEEYQNRLKTWQKENEPLMKEYQEKIKAWHEENKPQMEEFQKQMEVWQKENEPLMKEYQERIKTWQEENKPQLEEFQKQMEVWQKENQEKLKEFQKKMAEWQKEHAQQLKELQKTIQEQFKKEEN